LCGQQGSPQCVNEVLILLINHLMQNLRQSCCWVFDLSHHDNDLANDDCAIQRVGDL
jgi:hypothetical protein